MPYPLTQVGRATTRLWHHIRRWKKIRSVRSHGSKNRAGTLCGWILKADRPVWPPKTLPRLKGLLPGLRNLLA